MAGEDEVGYFRGSGGLVFDFPLPLSEIHAYKLTRGELVRVANAAGDPYLPPALETEPVDDGPVRPAVNAQKAEWVGYACAVDTDLTVDDADAMTKNDLIEKYGSK